MKLIPLVIQLTILILAMLSGLLIQPLYEVNSFNKCTGSNATYSDALFTELRVTECRK